jgi:hypothetical protein
VDLNTMIPQNSGWTLSDATDVNDAGIIVGYGTLKGVNHSFMLVPASQCSVRGPARRT